MYIYIYIYIYTYAYAYILCIYIYIHNYIIYIYIHAQIHNMYKCVRGCVCVCVIRHAIHVLTNPRNSRAVSKSLQLKKLRNCLPNVSLSKHPCPKFEVAHPAMMITIQGLHHLAQVQCTSKVKQSREVLVGAVT